jgi:hypothetical protein
MNRIQRGQYVAAHKTRLCTRQPDCLWCHTGTCWFAKDIGEVRCKRFAMGRPCRLPVSEAGRCENGFHTPPQGRFDPSTAAFDPQDQPEDTRGSGGLTYLLPLEQYDLPRGLAQAIPQSKIEAGRGVASERYRVLAEHFGAFMRSPGVSSAMPAADVQRFLMAQQQAIEFYERSEIRNYDMPAARLVAQKRYASFTPYSVDCPGLAESRPSVLRGDLVVLRANEGGSYGRPMKGRVHHVNADHLIIAIWWPVQDAQTYQVVFTVPRPQFQRKYRAVDATERAFLTVQGAAAPGQPAFGAEHAGSFAALNAEQRAFIAAVGAGARRGHVLFGPPGTGKTTTLVALAAALHACGRARVLIATPSNVSADLFIKRFAEKNRAAYEASLRLMAFSRDPKLVDAEVQRRMKTEPTLAQLKAASIVVCTMSGAGSIAGMGVEPGHFTHIIIDEAGQATEQDTLLPLYLATAATTVVLAGDPKQLGPQIRSTVCQRLGMGCSALERLIREGAAHTLLTANYRAHPTIMALYNTLTYENKLLACGDPAATHAVLDTGLFGALGFNTAPVNTVPVAMMHSAGAESQAKDSPSWKNHDEMLHVVHMVDVALRRGVKPRDIVVLTPYRAQMKLIGDQLHYNLFAADPPRFPDYAAVKRGTYVRVCSVEAFQGGEAPLVILSCVRSKLPGELANDEHFSLGFLRQPNRINVAISRAIGGLIVVGNAWMLAVDEVTLRPLVKHIASLGAVFKSSGATKVAKVAMSFARDILPYVPTRPTSGPAIVADAVDDQPAVYREE